MKVKKEAFNNKRISALIVVIIVVLVLSLILMFRTFSNNIVDKITKTISMQYSQELNAQMSTHMSSTLEHYFHELNTEFIALSSIDNLDKDRLQEFISEAEVSNDISYIAFVDDEGNIYDENDTHIGTIGVKIIGKLLNGQKRVISDNVTLDSENYIVIGSYFDNPVKIGNKEICIGLLGMVDEDLEDHVVLQSDYSGGYSSVIHKNGSFVIKNPAETNKGLNIFSIIDKNYTVSDEDVAEMKKAVNNNEDYFLYAKSNDAEESIYLYFAPISGTNWYIANTLPSSFIKSSVVGLRNTMEKVYIAFVIFLIIVAAIIIVQQTSSRRKLAESQVELAKALDIAEEASGAKTAFLFNMSHDIRTPMNAILGYTDIGLKHVSDAEMSKDSFTKIKMAGGHLLNLINDILEMSRIESGKVELNDQPLDIRTAISDITTMSKSLAQAKSIDFKTVVKNIPNPYIYADELHVNEVIINIISNAVKYTPDGGKVIYTIEQTEKIKDGKTVFRFEVTDNGIGMSDEFQKHLFETFSREENTTMSKIEGTGLGLSIVKKIVDLAEGEISVTSVQNQGSTFVVEIPFKLMDEEAISKLEEERKEVEEIISSVSFSGRRVLLAEDNELNREIATFILEDAGLEVDTAEDGKLAVEAIEDKGISYYDFILMDIQMPVLNGYEATKKIRELEGGESIPIIALSANAFEEDKKKSIEEGMNAHVAKPIDIKVLIETIQGLIKS